MVCWIIQAEGVAPRGVEAAMGYKELVIATVNKTEDNDQAKLIQLKDLTLSSVKQVSSGAEDNAKVGGGGDPQSASLE